MLIALDRSIESVKRFTLDEYLLVKGSGRIQCEVFNLYLNYTMIIVTLLGF